MSGGGADDGGELGDGGEERADLGWGAEAAEAGEGRQGDGHFGLLLFESLVSAVPGVEEGGRGAHLVVRVCADDGTTKTQNMSMTQQDERRARGLTLVDLVVVSMELLGESLVRVSLDAERLADREDLFDVSRRAGSDLLRSSDKAWGRDQRTLKRNGRSSPNFATTFVPKSSGCLTRYSLSDSLLDARREGHDGCVPIHSWAIRTRASASRPGQRSRQYSPLRMASLGHRRTRESPAQSGRPSSHPARGPQLFERVRSWCNAGGDKRSDE